MTFVIAIDGPAGSGKSSVSKAVAQQLGFGYLDTGAGYRAFTLHAISNPSMALNELISSFDYEISVDPLASAVSLAGDDVTETIRTEKVATRVSEYARIPEIRELQHNDSRSRVASCQLAGIVAEGRDMTTAVFPDAPVRILLTASEEVRLRRREAEKTESSENLKARDASDSTVSDFMVPAEGVLLIDTSNLSFEESVKAVLDQVHRVKG
jgi:cytidylate kinase